MPLTIIIGTQWGDEGKGRVVDLLSAQADIVARYNGGDNAGHTVTVGSQTFKLHLLPTGLIHPQTRGVLGNGMVINPETLLDEIEKLRATGVAVSPERLQISYAAHLITPAHKALDQAQERMRGKSLIGTTGRGIGPAYTDRAARKGLRLQDMLDPAVFKQKLHTHLTDANAILEKVYHAEPLPAASICTEFEGYVRLLRPYISDTSLELYQALRDGKTILAEGAQGTLLDLDYGTYPYVTSSTPLASGALVGLGLGMVSSPRVVGVTKVFQTRVGSGPFPTEVFGEIETRLRGTGDKPWDEFGTTTGRPRRVGWLDGVLLRYALRINGVTELILTKLDVLSGLEKIRVCTHYLEKDSELTDLPFGPADLSPYEPVYMDLPGWKEDLQSVRRWEDLPAAAQGFVRALEDLAGVPVSQVSVGPEREQVVDIRR